MTVSTRTNKIKHLLALQCSDTVGLVTGRALMICKNHASSIPEGSLEESKPVMISGTGKYAS